MNTKSLNERQSRLAQLMIPGSLAIVPAAKFLTKSNDTEFPFRQDSNFKYLVGTNEPSAIFLLKKNLDSSIESTLFLRDKDDFAEMWSGIRMGVQKAKESLPINDARPIESFEQMLPELMKNTHKLYYDIFNLDLHGQILKSSKTLQSLRKKKIYRPQSIQNITPLIGSLRLIKDQNEIENLKEAAKLTHLGFSAAMAMTNSSKTEKDIERLLTHVFTLKNGQGHAYDPIVAGGQNALILHYIENDRPLKDDDWLLIDAGSQVDLYASDVTRTFPVNGKFSPAQRDLYQVVLEAQKAGLSKASQGHSLTDIHNATTKVLVQALIDEGILQGTLDGVIESGAHRAYYPHGTGHWLGLDVHDNCPYQDEELNDIKLKPGACFTVEPGLYFKADDSKIPAHWRGLGIRTEDDILITDDGHENLTFAIPKEVEEIEQACAKPFDDFLEQLF